MISESQLRILLVDADPTSVKLIEDALGESGHSGPGSCSSRNPLIAHYSIVCTDRIGSALTWFLQRTFDVVLLSLDLPDSHGINTLVRLRGSRYTGPIVVLMTRNDETLFAKAIQAGAQEVLDRNDLPSLDLKRMIRTAMARKQADGELRASEECFRSVFEHTNVAMVVTDLNHRFVRANAAFSELFGYTEAEMLQKSMPDITYPDDLAESLSLREQLLAGKSSFFQMRKRYRRRDGQILHCLTNVSLLRDSQGEPRLYIGQVQDVSERVRAEDANTNFLERIRILHQIDRALVSGEGPAAIASAALIPLRDLLKIPRAVVNLFDWERNEVVWLAAVGRRRLYSGPEIRHSLVLVGDIDALRRGEMQLIDVRELPPSREVDAMLAAGVQAYVVVPMISESRLIGALSLGIDTSPLSSEQVRIAQQVATQFAVALAQARLHEQIQRQAVELDKRLAELNTTERALDQAEQRLEHVVASNPAVLYTLACKNERVELTWISDNVQDMLGYSVHEALQPKWWRQRVHDEDHDRVQFEIRNILFEQNRLSHEHRFRHKDGSERWIRNEMKLLRDATGVPVEIVGSWSDVTERKSLESQFHQAQKMEAVGQLAGGIAHDFNNLLTVILGYGEILLESFPPDHPALTYVQAIREAGDRAAALTRQLLAFSRKAVLEPKVLELNDVVRDTDKLLRRLIGEDVQVAAVLDPKISRIKVDPGQLGQVLMNLAVNARDAMSKGGKLTLETRNTHLDEEYTRLRQDVVPGRYVLLSITDTGCGMTDSVKTRIFEPFFTTKKVGEGTGLGLAVVQGVVKQSGGHIEVYSEPGIGTSFKLYFPAVDDEISTTGHDIKGASIGGAETVLVVEDEDGVRRLAVFVMQSNGYRVLVASHAEEALRVAKQHQGNIDLLMTDVVMPGMGGPDLAHSLLKLYPRMKVLFSSGYTDDAVVRHGLIEENVAFLQKPYSPIALARKVRHVLDEM